MNSIEAGTMRRARELDLENDREIFVLMQQNKAAKIEVEQTSFLASMDELKRTLKIRFDSGALNEEEYQSRLEGIEHRVEDFMIRYEKALSFNAKAIEEALEEETEEQVPRRRKKLTIPLDSEEGDDPEGPDASYVSEKSEEEPDEIPEMNYIQVDARANPEVCRRKVEEAYMMTNSVYAINQNTNDTWFRNNNIDMPGKNTLSKRRIRLTDFDQVENLLLDGFRQMPSACKMDITFGCVVLNSETGEFSAGNPRFGQKNPKRMINVLGKLIRKKRDLDEIIEQLTPETIKELWGQLWNEDTKSALVGIHSVAIRFFKTNLTKIRSVPEDCICDRKNRTYSYQGKDYMIHFAAVTQGESGVGRNMCMLSSIVVAERIMKGKTARYDGTTRECKKLFAKCFPEEDIDSFEGVDFERIPEIEKRHKIKIYLYVMQDPESKSSPLLLFRQPDDSVEDKKWKEVRLLYYPDLGHVSALNWRKVECDFECPECGTTFSRLEGRSKPHRDYEEHIRICNGVDTIREYFDEVAKPIIPKWTRFHKKLVDYGLDCNKIEEQIYGMYCLYDLETYEVTHTGDDGGGKTTIVNASWPLTIKIYENLSGETLELKLIQYRGMENPHKLLVAEFVRQLMIMKDHRLSVIEEMLSEVDEDLRLEILGVVPEMPVIGLKREGSDLNAIKSFIDFSDLNESRTKFGMIKGINTMKRGTDYLLFGFKGVVFRDFKEYVGPGYDLKKLYSDFGVEEPQFRTDKQEVSSLEEIMNLESIGDRPSSGQLRALHEVIEKYRLAFRDQYGFDLLERLTINSAALFIRERMAFDEARYQKFKKRWLKKFSKYRNEIKVASSTIKRRIESHERQDEEAGRKCCLAVSDVKHLLRHSHGVCFWCRCLLTGKNWSLDRIDCTEGHKEGNLLVTCRDCNKGRSDTAYQVYLDRVSQTAYFKKYTPLMTISDRKAYRKLSQSKYGGLAMVFTRLAKFGSPIYVANYREDGSFDGIEKTGNKFGCVMIVDANNLYGWSQSQMMPCGELEYFDFDWYDGDLLKDVSGGDFFGFVEVDITVPDNLVDKYEKFPPFIMHDSNGKLNCMRSGKRLLLPSDMLKWYLEKGMLVTRVHGYIQAEGRVLYKDFVDQHSQMRRDHDGVFGLLGKNIPNCSGGASLRRRDQDTRTNYYANDRVGELMLLRQVAHRKFVDMEENLTGITEVTVKKRGVKHSEPIQTGVMMLALAKMKLLQFVYDFLDRFIDKSKYNLLMTDTDSIGIGLSVDPRDIESDCSKWYKPDFVSRLFREMVPDEMLDEYDAVCSEYLTSDEFSSKTPGLMKIEAIGESFVGICGKTYYMKTFEGDSAGQDKLGCAGTQRNEFNLANVLRFDKMEEVVRGQVNEVLGENRGYRKVTVDGHETNGIVVQRRRAYRNSYDKRLIPEGAEDDCFVTLMKE